MMRPRHTITPTESRTEPAAELDYSQLGFTQGQIDELNRILTLCGSVRLTQYEIDFMIEMGETIDEYGDYYRICQDVLLSRYKKTEQGGHSLFLLRKLANNANVSLEAKQPVKPDVHIPIYGGGL